MIACVDWDAFDAETLFETVRAHGTAPDAEQTIWAFEQALRVARLDPALLEHLLVATVSLLALDRGETPRTVLEQTFRRAVGDEDWRDDYASLAG